VSVVAYVGQIGRIANSDAGERKMNNKGAHDVWTTMIGRRRALTGAAVFCGGLVLTGKSHAHGARTDNDGCKLANSQRTSLHQEVDLPASPDRIYKILLDSKQFADLTGMPAQIEATAGGAFSMFGKIIFGRNVELIPNQLIVQAWGDKGWGSSMYSIAKFALQAQGSQTKVVLDHTGFPEGSYDHLYEGWYGHYWDPLKKHFSS
jgi:activator of HSP90 ATPase